MKVATLAAELLQSCAAAVERGNVTNVPALLKEAGRLARKADTEGAVPEELVKLVRQFSGTVAEGELVSAADLATDGEPGRAEPSADDVLSEALSD